jgi:lipid-binding SYLF domain-containing protein
VLEKVIHAGAESTLTWLTTKDPGLKPLLDKAYGYAVFPAVGRASAVVGGARGHGEVFEHGKPIGFATLSQMTLGVQVGGQTLSEVILFNDKGAMDRFKSSKVSFTANASAVMVKAGATGTSNFQSVVAKAYSRGGMLLEASIGGQKLSFRKHLDKSKKRKGDSEAEIPRIADEKAEEKPAMKAKEVDSPKPAEEADTAEAEAAPAQEQEGEGEVEPSDGGAAPAQDVEPAPEKDSLEASAMPDEAGSTDTGGYDDPPQDLPDVSDDATDPVEDPPDDPPQPVRAAAQAVSAQKPSSGADGAVASAAGAIEEQEEQAEPPSVRRRISGSGRKLAGKVAHFFSEHAGPKGLDRVGLEMAAKRHPTLIGKPVHLLHKLKSAAIGLEKEATLGPVLSNDVNAALRRMIEHDPGLKGLLDTSYAYAVFPLVGKATAALGIGFGRGEVFEQGRLIGYAGIVQLTVGVQLGGQTCDELIIFENEGALERFKSGNLAFAMNASAVILKAGAAATTSYSSGTAVFVHPEGGLIFELGLGGQKFIFRKKALGAPDVELEDGTSSADRATEAPAPS